VSEVSESMREDEDKQVQISVPLQEKNALLEARVAQLERQLRQQARGEKVAVPAVPWGKTCGLNGVR
jgi:BMFP domain-containing protein YqiC